MHFRFIAIQYNEHLAHDKYNSFARRNSYILHVTHLSFVLSSEPANFKFRWFILSIIEVTTDHDIRIKISGVA